MASTWHHVSRDYPTRRGMPEAQALGERVMEALLDYEAGDPDVRDPSTATSGAVLTVDLDVYAADGIAAGLRFDEVLLHLLPKVRATSGSRAT